jgi:hypothetical protein
MYSSIIENEEIMANLKSDKENYEVNCIILKQIRNQPYESQLVVANALMANDRVTKSRINKENYEKNRTRRLEEQKKRDNEIGECPNCNMRMKKGLIQKHKNTKKCIDWYETQYGEIEKVKCELCKLSVKFVLLNKHENSKKCLDRQELLKELMEE